MFSLSRVYKMHVTLQLKLDLLKQANSHFLLDFGKEDW